MTSRTTTLIREADGIAGSPVFEPRDDMQNWVHLYDSAVLTALSVHFAELPNTVVASEVPVDCDLSDRDDIRIPDPVAFECDRELIEDRRGYALELMERPPDLVLEVASPTTGVTDYTDKHLDCARYAIPECWGLDPSGGDHYDDALAGDGLVDGVYEPIEIEQVAEDVLQGHSDLLGLDVRWHDGRLEWHDPETGRHIATFDDERARADAAEARNRELEEELRQLRGK